MAKKGGSHENDKTLVILAHVLGIFTYFIGPLIIMLTSESEYVKKHCRNALNWQFSALIYCAISLILIFILIGVILIWAIGILNIIFSIIAAVKASEGKFYEYPLSIKFYK